MKPVESTTSRIIHAAAMVSLKPVLFVLTVLYSFSCLEAVFIASASLGVPRKVALNRDLVLECISDDQDQSLASAVWKQDGEELTSSKTGRYRIEANKQQTSLKIRHFTYEDSPVENWSVMIGDVVACTFPKESIEVIPSPQAISTDRADEIVTANETAIRRYMGEKIRLKCEIKPNSFTTDPSKNITWTFNTDLSNFHEVLDHVSLDRDTLFISKLSKRDRGYYRCSYNDYDFVIFLRVKDKYGPIWSFLAIVIATVITAVISVFYARANKAKKKAKGKNLCGGAESEAADLFAKSTVNNEEIAIKQSVQA